MHGPITQDIDRRKRFKYPAKAWHIVMKPFNMLLNDINKDDGDDIESECPTPAQCCTCAACVYCGIPSVTAAAFASSCAFFGGIAIDAKNSKANEARDLQIKNLLPGISMDIFDKSKPINPPDHQKMNEDKYSPHMR